jgi:hypothetical protein
VGIFFTTHQLHTGCPDFAQAVCCKKQHINTASRLPNKQQLTPITRYFRDVAKHVLHTIDKDLASENGKAIYREYKVIIEKYLIPFLGKYHIDTIDYPLLERFDGWRAEKMGKVPTYSTVLNHNAALKRVFDEAIYRGFVVESRLPKLVAKGKKSERRAEFTLDEVRIIRQVLVDHLSY